MRTERAGPDAPIARTDRHGELIWNADRQKTEGDAAVREGRLRELVFGVAKTLQDGDSWAETWADMADDLDRAARLCSDIAEERYRAEGAYEAFNRSQP
jgi:hypothetical protein